MKTKLINHSLGMALVFGAFASAQAQQVPAPKTPAEVTAPADGINMTPEYARSVAKSAYIWGWTMVNMLNRNAKITQAPHPGLLNGVLPAAPRGQVGMLHDYIEPSETFVACPNQDVVYGLGFFSLNDEPVIAQVPDFGDRFWLHALYDALTDQFGELGKPYGSKPGFYLLVGPNWKGEKPADVPATNFIQTVSARNFLAAVRLYGTGFDFFDQTWKPDDVVKVK